MGFMDYSISGSDCAFDAHLGAISTMNEYYIKHLKGNEKYDNAYNTPTALNIAMSINEAGKAFWCYCWTDEDEKNIFDLVDAKLKELISTAREYRKDCRRDGLDTSDVEWHLSEYTKIAKKFRSIKKAVEKYNTFE